MSDWALHECLAVLFGVLWWATAAYALWVLIEDTNNE